MSDQKKPPFAWFVAISAVMLAAVLAYELDQSIALHKELGELVLEQDSIISKLQLEIDSLQVKQEIEN